MFLLESLKKYSVLKRHSNIVYFSHIFILFSSDVLDFMKADYYYVNDKY
jgi:hypothetical protein